MYAISKLVESIETTGNAKVFDIYQSEKSYKFTVNANGDLLVDGEVADMKVLASVLPFLIYNSIYKKISIKTYDDEQNADNKKAADYLANMAIALLSSVSNKDLTDVIIGGEYAFEDIFGKKVEMIDQNIVGTIDDLEQSMSNLESALFTVYFIWREMQSATNVAGYKIARSRWDALCKSEETKEDIKRG